MRTPRKQSLFKLDCCNYEVEVSLRLWQQCGVFSIKATDKTSQRYSYVTNINGLASQFSGYDAEIPAMGNSTWENKTPKVKRWYAEAKEFLSDRQFQTYFARCLDDDRCAGEWDNILEKAR